MADSPVAPLEPPGRNGSGSPAGAPGRTSLRRRLAIAGTILFVGAWTIAIVYSVTAGGRSPERLSNADAAAVQQGCKVARAALEAIPQLSAHPTRDQVATRIEEENPVFGSLVRRFRAIHPAQKTPAIALTHWTDDWQGLVTARQHYARDLRNQALPHPQFLEPATNSIKPIADKMTNWVLEQGTRTNQCKPDALQIEVVDGPRTYTDGSGE